MYSNYFSVCREATTEHIYVNWFFPINMCFDESVNRSILCRRKLDTHVFFHHIALYSRVFSLDSLVKIKKQTCTLKKKSVKQSMFKGLIKMQRIINPIHPFMKFVINPLFNRKKYGKKAFLKIINWSSSSENKRLIAQKIQNGYVIRCIFKYPYIRRSKKTSKPIRKT